MTFSAPTVTIRPALPADKADVLEFCKGIWEGEDYIAYVWDWWMASPEGEMFVAEYAGKAVGLARLTHLAPGQWWLEGFRVDPQHQDKRIGSRLHEYLVTHWHENGDGTLRLWTSSKNARVHHLCTRTGFVKIEEHAIYSAPALPSVSNATGEFSSIAPPEIPAAAAFALNAESTTLTGPLMDAGWCMARVHESLLGKFLSGEREGQVLWWRGRNGLLCLWENDDDPGQKTLMVAFAACAPQQFPALLQAARQYAGQNGYARLEWNVWLHPPLIEFLTRQGFTCDWDGSNFQFEQVHPTRP